MKLKSVIWLTFIILAGSVPVIAGNVGSYLRVNQLGYRPDDPKIAILLTGERMKKGRFEVVDAGSGRVVRQPQRIGKFMGELGNFQYHFQLDFSDFTHPGRYRVRIQGTTIESLPFTIADTVYTPTLPEVLGYIRQQRCGYNPFFDNICHQRDGKTMYGPMPDSTYIDVSGGWHDAGDHLRYLLTSGNTVGRLLTAYRTATIEFADEVDASGKSGSNGIPDILDEARWGLEWMLKMHPHPDQLFHQVADDRDHIGFKLPFADSADYGWGPGSYRVVYYASGASQGLGKYQNTSTGIANLAGRYAATMALAHQIWTVLGDEVFARTCLQAGREVYEMGLRQPGCQEGTPCRAPYRYQEVTWADDMEWGAAELYRVTGDDRYLKDAKRFARMAGADPWMGADTARHYEFYPFMNLGHFALFDQVDPAFQDTLIGYYRRGIEAVADRAANFAYGIGVPFIWCSNNLAAAFINQCLLYERMSGDRTYHEQALAQVDWLLGRNPWGVTQFVGIPAEGGVTPLYPHTAVTIDWNQPINGGMNDGPVYASIYNSLKGIRLSRPDPYTEFQSELVVFHDDLWDYSTNEPTLDGTAEALLFLTLLAR
ncbi:MAG: glycoside hydrolase family 9 protein [Candidatus Neomarinimicrobiota bacterium]